MAVVEVIQGMALLAVLIGLGLALPLGLALVSGGTVVFAAAVIVELTATRGGS